MKQKYAAKGLIMIGSLRKAGVTTYVKQGQVITRVSNSDEKRSNTLGQFNFFIRRKQFLDRSVLQVLIDPCQRFFSV